MSKLLDQYVEYLPISTFLDTLIAGLKDHNYNKIACCHILRKAVHFAPIEIVESKCSISEILRIIFYFRFIYVCWVFEQKKVVFVAFLLR